MPLIHIKQDLLKPIHYKLINPKHYSNLSHLKNLIFSSPSPLQSHTLSITFLPLHSFASTHHYGLFPLNHLSNPPLVTLPLPPKNLLCLITYRKNQVVLRSLQVCMWLIPYHQRQIRLNIWIAQKFRGRLGPLKNQQNRCPRTLQWPYRLFIPVQFQTKTQVLVCHVRLQWNQERFICRSRVS